MIRVADHHDQQHGDRVDGSQSNKLAWRHDGTVWLMATTGAGVWILLNWDVGAEGQWEGFESPWYWRSALLLVAVGCVAGRHRPDSSRQQIVAATLPPALVLVVQAQLFYDVDDGANLWPLGLVFLVTQWCLATAVGAGLGGRFHRLENARRERKRSPPGDAERPDRAGAGWTRRSLFFLAGEPVARDEATCRRC